MATALCIASAFSSCPHVAGGMRGLWDLFDKGANPIRETPTHPQDLNTSHSPRQPILTNLGVKIST